MYGIEKAAPKPAGLPVTLPEALVPEGEGKATELPKLPPQINPFEMPALTSDFSKEVLAKIHMLKGAQSMINSPIEPVGSVIPKMDVPSMAGVNPDGNADAPMVSGKLPPQVKNINSLVPGQTFSAEILDIKQGSISLKMADGGSLTARSLVMPDARIGDTASFVVRETKPGQIFLEFLRGGEGKVSQSIIREALTASNMQHTGANASIVEDLVVRGMPIDVSTMQRAAFFKYSMPNAPFEHIQFLVQNNFAPIERTVQVFTGIMSGEMTLEGEIAKAIAQMESAALQKAASTPSGAQGADAWEGLLNQLKAHQAVDVKPQGQAQAQGEAPAPANPLNLPVSDPNALLEAIKTISQEISAQARSEGNTVLAQLGENISDLIDFSKNITEGKQYFQIPFSAENQHLAQLHVFKKKGGAGKRGDGKVATALIALDMAFLGRVEILVNKNDKNVSLQFRSDKDSTVEQVSYNRLELSDLLKDAGYALTGIRAKKITEKFDLPDDEQKATGIPLPTMQSSRYDDTNRRYSFDARV